LAVEKKITSRNIREIVRGLEILVDENKRFERLTATQETLSLVYANADVYEQALNMLTGNNRLILEAGFESSVNKRYRIVRSKLCELNTLQFAVIVNIFPALKYYMLLKERCEVCNDNTACIMLEERIKGDPDADDEVSRLGLLGLWGIEDNRQAGEMLVALGAITEEKFKRTVAERDGVKVPPAAPPAAPPAIPSGFEDDIRGMKARGEEWGNVLTYIDKTYGYDEKLIGKATEIYYKPAPETTSSPGLEDMKHTIKDRLDKLKTQEPEPFVVN